MNKAEQIRYPVILTNLLLGVALSFFILFPGTGGYGRIQNGKFELFCLLFGGYLILMVLFTAEMVLLRRIRLPRPRQLWSGASWEERLIFLFWLMTLISTLLSPYGQDTLLGLSRNEGFLTQTIYCGTFLCVARFARPKAWMMHLLSAVMTLFCGICIWQMRGGNPLGLYPAGTDFFGANRHYPGMYLGTMGNADLTAALFCLVIPMFAVWLLLGKQRSRFWAAVPLVLCLVTVIKAHVQAGILGTVCGMALVLPVVLPVKPAVKKWIWGALFLFAAAALCYAYTNHRTWGLAYELREILHGNFDSSFGSGRMGIWKEILSRVPEQIAFGYGPDTMAAEKISLYSKTVNGTEIPLVIDVAHNEYINILYHQGVFALLFYLSALGIAFVRWIRNGRKDAAAAACGGAVLCYGIQALFGFSMCPTAALFWLAFAVLNRQTREVIS